MREKVIEALIELGVDMYTKGASYIIEAVCLLDCEQYKNDGVVNLYKKVGEICNEESWKNVERCMRSVLEKLFIKGDPVIVEKYLSLANTATGSALWIMHYRLSKM